MWLDIIRLLSLLFLGLLGQSTSPIDTNDLTSPGWNVCSEFGLNWHQFLSFDCDNILRKSKCKRFIIDCQTIVGSHRNDASNALVVGVQIQQTWTNCHIEGQFHQLCDRAPTHAPSTRTQFHLGNISWKPSYFQLPLLKYLPR
jgi:hypothetical protein